MGIGAWGQQLDTMLREAKSFVEQNGDECLFFRFDKCDGWPQIAQMIFEILGSAPRELKSANLNLQTARALRGKVICLFPDAERAKIGRDVIEDPGRGFYFWRNGHPKDGKSTPYNSDFQGLQYWGKYSDTKDVGTNYFGNTERQRQQKADANVDRQAEKLAIGAQSQDPDCLGMMYWTATGKIANVLARDVKLKEMMTPGNAKFQEIWEGGVQESVEHRLKTFTPSDIMASKAWCPNIVMLDNVQKDCCDAVWEMNQCYADRVSKMLTRHVAQTSVAQRV